MCKRWVFNAPFWSANHYYYYYRHSSPVLVKKDYPLPVCQVFTINLHEAHKKWILDMSLLAYKDGRGQMGENSSVLGRCSEHAPNLHWLIWFGKVHDSTSDKRK